jgi:hypothetical protein
VGIVLLIIGSGGIGDSTFFIFPFFFFSTSEPLGIFMFLGLTLIIVFLMIRTISEVSYNQETGDRLYSRTKCVYCSSQVPRGASFCPTCGNPLNDDSMVNE